MGWLALIANLLASGERATIGRERNSEANKKKNCSVRFGEISTEEKTDLMVLQRGHKRFF